MKLFGKLKSSLHRFATGYYNLLLIILTAVIVLRPEVEDRHYIIAWKLLFVCMLLAAVFNAHSHRIVKWITAGLLIPILILGRITLSVEIPAIFIGNIVCTVLFIAITAGAILYDVVFRTRVTLETLKGAICAYLLLAIGFAYVYYLLEYLNPSSFLFTPGEFITVSHSAYLSKMIYFSFMTVLSIGFGDIMAIHNLGQTIVIIEGIIGEFYLAILVARLVAAYTLYGSKASNTK